MRSIPHRLLCAAALLLGFAQAGTAQPASPHASELTPWLTPHSPR